MNNPGEHRAWDLLAELKPDEVCTNACVDYDAASASYRVRSFGMEFVVSLRDRITTGNNAAGSVLLGRQDQFFGLSLLWYLVSARNIACTERQVSLDQIRGGDIFTRGTHMLPLEGVAERFGRNRDEFMRKGKQFGGETVHQGDVAMRLFPFPRVPVILTLWLEDEEFPARVTLTVDSTCELQLPTDVIWSVAVMSLRIMLEED
jgi:hypothetical protein